MPGLRPRSRTSVYSLALAALAAPSAPGGVARLPPFARSTVLRIHGLGRPRGSRRAFRSWRSCAAAALRTEYRATPPWLRPRSRTSVYSLGLALPGYEHPVVEPQVSQRMQVPLRTRVKWPQTGQGSPS